MSTICPTSSPVAHNPESPKKGRYHDSKLRTHVTPFGIYLLDRLDERPHFTISGVAHHLGMTRNRLNYSLGHPRTLSFAKVIAIGEYLQVPLQELMTIYLVSVKQLPEQEKRSAITDLVLLVEAYMQVPEKQRHLALNQVRGLLKAYSEEPQEEEEEGVAPYRERET